MIHAAGLILRAPDGRILLIERSAEGDHAGEWAFPGGKIEAGETAAEAAERECREEIGPASYDNPRLVDHRRDEKVDFVTYLANVPATFAPKLNGEHTAATWVRPDDAPSPMHPGAAATLRKIGDMMADMPTRKTVLSPIDMDSAIILSLPTVIKARPVEKGGRRIVEVEASCEEVDSEGDVILQSALLDAAADFVATGCLDIDHISELGYRLGIPDPASYVVGRPLEVKALEGRRTSVVGELRRSADGSHNPQRCRYDDLWESLQSDPPVPWFASIFGFPLPGMMEDCSTGTCAAGARRYLIRGINWRSLAFTRNPVNGALRGKARIVTAKSAMARMAKDMGIINAQPPSVAPLAMDDLWAGRGCGKCGIGKAPSLSGYRDHFALCMGMDPRVADVCAHALMHKTNMERVFPSLSP